MHIENFLTHKVRRKNSKSGYGIFAIKPIKKGETVAIFGGLVISAKEMDKADTQSLQIADNFFLKKITKNKKVDEAEYINHSCNPNCGIKGQIILETMCDIKSGEEITFDYAMTDAYFSKIEKFICTCGSKNCRKLITPNDWKIKKLQKKYKGYFSYYIEKK